MQEELVQTLNLQPKAASVAQLEAELVALWRSAAAGHEGGPAVTRSCALTFLVYLEGEEGKREVLDLIRRVALRRPCRVVVMVAEPAARPAGMSAQISAACRLPAPGEKEVCYEQVSLAARGEAVAGLEQVVIPLLVPGLPVYLWCRVGRFKPLEHLRVLLRSVDRVLVDSARFSHPETDLPQFAVELRKQSGTPVFTDLNWARLTPWRELVAQCFDAPETRPCLDALTEVRFEYEQDSPRVREHRAQSLLLAGWLASQLGWEPTAGGTIPGGGTCSFLFRSAAGEVRVERIPGRFEARGDGSCVSITLKSQGSCPGTFSLRRGRDGKHVLVRSQTPGRPPLEHAVRLQVADEAELVDEELRFAGRDRVYEEALAIVARLAAHPS